MSSLSRGEDKRNNSRLTSRSISVSTPGSRISTNRDSIRCYKCRVNEHFASNCPNSVTNEESDCDVSSHPALQMLTPESPVRSGSCGAIDYLNFLKVRIVPPYFYL